MAANWTDYPLTLVNGQIDNAEHWVASTYSADWGNNEEVKAAPGAGYALCLTKIVFVGLTARSCTFGEGGAGAGNPTTILLRFLTTAADSSGKVVYKFLRPIEITANTNLTFDSGLATASQSGSVIIHGFTRKTT